MPDTAPAGREGPVGLPLTFALRAATDSAWMADWRCGSQSASSSPRTRLHTRHASRPSASYRASLFVMVPRRTGAAPATRRIIARSSAWDAISSAAQECATGMRNRLKAGKSKNRDGCDFDRFSASICRELLMFDPCGKLGDAATQASVFGDGGFDTNLLRLS